MRKLSVGFWVGSAFLAISAGAHANTIIYDYIGDPLVASVINGVPKPVPGATKVTATVEFSGSTAAAIRSPGTYFISEPSLKSVPGSFPTLNPPSPDIKWSISNGATTYTQATAAGTGYLLAFNFQDGALISSLLNGTNVIGFPNSSAGDSSIFISTDTTKPDASISRTSLATGNIIRVAAPNNSIISSGFINAQEVLSMEAKGNAQWVLRTNLSAVPVPAALPLLASALGMFGFARRRFA